ncbi:MAG: Coenzyme F420:L-glutamate ligase [Methanosaeta sp. PtaU1.Bin028]|nr:MAG: Coenzyme F420:L-glutamate ligase [Methanosaeta sp. PtaU1.Bin028]
MVDTLELSLRGFLVRGLPSICEGDQLATMIEERADLQDGDVLCIASTVVAKAEGRQRSLKSYEPSGLAMKLAGPLNKDPRFVQAVLEESKEVLLTHPFLLVVTNFGHTCVNAGIDRSNVPGDEQMLLLPRDPSASARQIRNVLSRDCAVIVTDTCGRPFRCGVAGAALGCAGIAPIRDWRGQEDLQGRTLEITLEAVADELAGIANLLMGEADGGTPVAILRGLSYPREGGDLFWPDEKDMIRRHLRPASARPPV